MATDWTKPPSATGQESGSTAPSQPFATPQIHNLGDILDWQRAALQEAIFRKGTSDANRAELRKKLAALPPVYSLPAELIGMAPTAFYIEGAKHYDQMPPVARGLYDALLDTGTDPLTVETLDTGAIGKQALRLLRPIANPAARLALRAFPGLEHLPEIGQRIVDDLITKPLNFGGSAIAKHGRTAANEAIAMVNRQAAEERELTRRLNKLNDNIMKGLTPKQTSAVQKIMHGQLPDDVVARVYEQDPMVRTAVKARRELTDAIIRMQAKPGGGVTTQLLKGRGVANQRLLRASRQAASRELPTFTPGRGMSEAEAQSRAAKTAAMTPEDLAASNQRLSDLENEFAHETALTNKAVKKGAQQTAERSLNRHILSSTEVGVKPLKPGAARSAARAAAEPTPLRFRPVGEVRPLRLPELPPELQHFTGNPGEFTAANVRQNYFPARGMAQAIEPNQPAHISNLLETRNPHLKEQGEFHIPSRAVQHFEDAFKGMLKTSARNITANRVKAELAQMYPKGVPPEIQDLFSHKVPATGMARTGKEMALDFIKGAVGLPKVGIVGTSTIHMFNILALLLAHDPAAVPGAVKNFYHVLRAGGDEEKRFAALLPAIEKGIDISTHEKGGTILSKMPLNRYTWDWDAAAKEAHAQSYIRQGYSPRDAGIRATNDLVNYRNTSPATAALRYFMPFATFAEGGAKSVGAALLKNPAQLEFVNRLTGGKFLGGGDQTEVRSYQPPADVGRGLPTYLRGKTSDLVKIPLAAGVGALPGGGRLSHWILSGRTPQGAALDYATSWLPYSRDVLNMIPMPGGKTIRGFTPDPWQSTLLYQGTGVALPTKPKPSTAPGSPTTFSDWTKAPGASAAPAATAPTAAAPAASPGVTDWTKPPPTVKP